jgi:eukaryotic-like serine/threonine-protein kinase
VVSDRYTAPVLVRRSSSACVYRAYDSQVGELVALKRALDPESSRRIVSEAMLVQRLDHSQLPIVVELATDDAGLAFVATRWIDGPTLAERLEAGALPVDDAVRVAYGLGRILGDLHRAGIVHRDVKPSNVLLASGSLDDVRLVDFGIAGTESEIAPGVPIGTPGYLPPEQARGERVDARADVFGLGSVLFACLTGRPPFAGDGITATLARLLFETTPSVKRFVPSVPVWLDELVQRLLSKTPAGRPRDGHEVARLLDPDAREASALSLPGWALGHVEQRIVSVMCARVGSEEPLDDVTRSMVPSSRSGYPSAEIGRALAACRALGASVELVAGDVIVAVIETGEDADQRALGALGCARAVATELGDAPTALATGLGAKLGWMPTGETIERALALLGQGRKSSLIVDRTTGALLATRFRVDELPDGALLFDAPPRPTREPFVGRGEELARVEAEVASALGGEGSRVVELTGPAGIGKTRLSLEVVRRIDERVAMWRARGDPLGDARPLHVAAELVRSAFGSSAALRRHARRVFSGRDARRVAAFLGELVGSPPGRDEPLEMRAARQDPLLMADQVRRAFLDLTEAVSAERGLCMVVDDLQHVDLASVELLRRAFEEEPAGRLVLLVSARPDAATKPALAAYPRRSEIELGPLGPQESRLIVSTFARGSHPEAWLDELTRRGVGNPFFLRELARGTEADAKLPAPDTVLSVLSTHLERLPAEARRLLRAASFYGTFSLAALAPLTKGSSNAEHGLEQLLDEGLIQRAPRPFADAEPAYAFSHDLVRDAALLLSTAEDVEHGHRAAGRYLAAFPDSDPHAVAEHFFRGRDLERGADWMTRAAERALQNGALDDAERLAERAIAFGATLSTLGRSRLVLARVKRWQGAAPDAHASARSAVELLPDGSAELAGAFGELATACGRLRFADELEEHAARMLDLLDQAVTGPLVAAASRAIVQLYYNGRGERARVGLQRLESIPREALENEPIARARLSGARSVRAMFAGDSVGQLEEVKMARAAFLEAGDVREACLYELTIGHAFIELGCYEDAGATLRESRRAARRLGAKLLENLATLNLGLALARSGDATVASEAVELERATVLQVEHGGDARVRSAASCYLTEALMANGEYEAAERDARRAMELCEGAATLATLARALLAEVLLLRGEAQAVSSIISEGASEAEASEEGACRMQLVVAEHALALGDHARAAETLKRANEKLAARANAILDPKYRESFLGRVREHARIVELARTLGVQS